MSIVKNPDYLIYLQKAAVALIDKYLSRYPQIKASINNITSHPQLELRFKQWFDEDSYNYYTIVRYSTTKFRVYTENYQRDFDGEQFILYDKQERDITSLDNL